MAELAFQRLHRDKEKERVARIRQPEVTPQQIGNELTDQLTRAPTGGDPLHPALRADLEQKFGRDLSDIRVHTNPDAHRATTASNAVALTRGAHIFFAAPNAALNKQIVAHELTHAIQQGTAPPVRFSPAQQTRASPVPLARQAPTSAKAGPAPPAQKLDFDVLGVARRAGGALASGISSAAGAVVDFGSDLLASGRDAVMAAIRSQLPEFLPMFEGDGIGSFLRRLIERGMRSMFDGLTAPLRGIIDVDALGRDFRAAIEGISRIAGQLANNDCSGILEVARTVSRVVSETLSPVIDSVKATAAQIEGFFRGIWESISLPIMEMLRGIGGAIWESLSGFVSDLASLIRRARAALGSAWDTVKGWLGIRAEDGESEGGGLWNWIRDKASAIGNTISDTIRPVLGPLRQAAGTMLLILPGGQLLGIILLWPQLRQGFDWISQAWTDLNLIPRARDAIANQIIPQLISGAESFGQAVISGADWLLGQLDSFHGALASIAEAAVGILTPLATLIGVARDLSHRLITWAREKLQALSRNLHSILMGLIDFMRRVGDALRDLIAAIVNPFGIVGFLAGHLWLALPECLKGPIIDFLLDIVEAFIEALPNNPLMGILWPVVKSALLGFVRKVKSVALAEKIELADKIAKIISGQSFDFAIGYLKGIVLGIWEAIIAPFQALALIFELPDRIQRFLENLGVSLCEIVEQIRCFLATLASSVFGRLDDLLGTLQEYLEDPSKILDLINCAIEGLLSSAESLGGQLAEGMLGIFRESEEAIGERLGRFTGSLIVQAVIAYFTAGVSAGVGIAGRIAEMLGAVGRALQEVLQFITQQLSRLINFIKGFIARIGRAIVNGARSIFARMKGFFRRIFAWLRRLFRRLFRGLRRRFMLTAEERIQWREFRLLLRESLAVHRSGITRRELRALFRRHLQQFRSVAKWPAYITKHGPNWRLHVRRVKSIIPRSVGEVPLDPQTRLRAGTREAKREVRILKATHRNIGLDNLQPVLERVRERYDLTTMTARYQQRDQAFHVHGAVNPIFDWLARPNRPDNNVVTSATAHRSITVNPLTKLQIYSPPTSLPWSPWDEVSVIRAAPTGTSSLYVRGHIAHGRFVNGHASNLMPISRDANALMRNRAEGQVIGQLRRRLSTRPVFVYQVTTGAPSPGTLIPRKVPRASGGFDCRTVTQERQLVRSISMTATPYTYNPTSKQWDTAAGSAITANNIPNVPSGGHYPRGHGEPC